MHTWGMHKTRPLSPEAIRISFHGLCFELLPLKSQPTFSTVASREGTQAATLGLQQQLLLKSYIKDRQ
jgi:hypothetical protein